jgi:hypothetical protein
MAFRSDHPRCQYLEVALDKLEWGDQLASLECALTVRSAKAQQSQPALEQQRRALAEETRRAERALVRYYAGFEAGDLDAKRFAARVSALEARLDAGTTPGGKTRLVPPD